MNSDLFEKIDRTAKMTVTYLRKSRNLLYVHTGRDLQPGYWDILTEAIESASEIIERLPDNFFETYRAKAARLRAHG